MADLDRQYQGLGRRPALVVVDMINGFTDPACALGSQADSVVRANQSLLEAFRRKGLYVCFTTVVYHHEDEARVFRDRLPALNVLQPGSHWVKIDPRLTPRNEEAVVEKKWASGFFATDLAGQLQAAGADSLVVTGLTTSGCVRATVLDGLQHDYRVVVPAEAVGDRNQEAHRANLFDMNAKYADVLDLKRVLGLIEDL